MGVFGEILNYRKFTDIKQAVDDYNAWDGSAAIFFNLDDSRFWTDATDRLLTRMPREPTAEDVVIVAKDFLPQKTRISTFTVKSMAENILKDLEINEKTKENEEIEA